MLNILKYPDPRLKEISTPVGFEQVSSLKGFCKDLIGTASGTPNCAGLAAPQVGVLKRIIVVFLGKKDFAGKMIPTLMINPTLVNPFEVDGVERDIGSQQVTEGCLSVPGAFTKVKRPSTVGLMYLDMEGEEHKLVLRDFQATLVQHEIDHLDGILFIDRISQTKRDRLIGKGR